MDSNKDSLDGLRRSEQRLRLIAESARDTIWTIAPDGRITYVSPAVEAVRGFTVEEAMRQPLEEIHPPESLARSAAYFGAMLQAITEGRTPEPFRGDLEYYRRDGSTFWTEVLAFPILDERGQLVELLGVSRDLSERRAREAEERGAQRLDAMARIAWGVSHEVNNALTIINSVTELLAARCDGLPEVQETAATIEGAVQRIASLTSRLLAFSRRRPSTLTSVRVGDLVARLTPELESIALPLRLTTTVAPDVAPVRIRVDPALLAESLDILLRNAAEAAGNEGMIAVHWSVHRLTESLPTRTRLLEPGEYVKVTVADDGAGMTAEAIERAFEPFHSTKQESGGHGLGLATVFGLTQQQAGGLTVESARDQGAQFSLWWSCDAASGVGTAPIPEASDSSTRARHTTAQPSPHDDRARTVLLVDDDAAVLQVTTRVLKRLGYDVLEASSAKEALSLTNDAAVDLLVSDVRMPGTNGFELVQALVQRGTDLPVLFISGDIGAKKPESWDGRVEPRFLTKPFTMEQIKAQLLALEVGASQQG